MTVNYAHFTQAVEKRFVKKLVHGIGRFVRGATNDIQFRPRRLIGC